MLIIGPSSVQRLGQDGKIEDLTPRPPQELLDAVVQQDKDLWQQVAQLAGLTLQEIEPQYRDKSPLTPWYQAEIADGVNVTVGTRYRVYAVKIESRDMVSAEAWNSLAEKFAGVHSVIPQWLDGKWLGKVSITADGNELEVHVDRGSEQSLIDLLECTKELFASK